MTKFSKFEILEAVIKSARDKTITLSAVEKYLKKVASADDKGYFDQQAKKAAIDHFRLAKGKEKSDKALINFLTKENEKLIQENAKLHQQSVTISDVKKSVDSLNAKIANLLRLANQESVNDASASQQQQTFSDSDQSTNDQNQ